MMCNHLNLLTPAELAKVLKKKERTIREMCYRGQIPYLKVGRSIRFNLHDVMDWLNNECRHLPSLGKPKRWHARSSSKGTDLRAKRARSS